MLKREGWEGRVDSRIRQFIHRASPDPRRFVVPSQSYQRSAVAFTEPIVVGTWAGIDTVSGLLSCSSQRTHKVHFTGFHVLWQERDTLENIEGQGEPL